MFGSTATLQVDGGGVGPTVLQATSAECSGDEVYFVMTLSPQPTKTGTYTTKATFNGAELTGTGTFGVVPGPATVTWYAFVDTPSWLGHYRLWCIRAHLDSNVS